MIVVDDGGAFFYIFTSTSVASQHSVGTRSRYCTLLAGVGMSDECQVSGTAPTNRRDYQTS